MMIEQSLDILLYMRILVVTLYTELLLCEYGYCWTLTILHTNDIHSRFDQFTVRDGRCLAADAAANQCFGGVARRVTKVRELRAQYDNVLLLDAGDQFQGSPWFTVYKGAAASYTMNKLKYDAMCLGNHEFDNGVEGLIPFLENLTFPVVSANVHYRVDSEGSAGEAETWNRLVKPYVILDVAGEKIGVLGYTARDTPDLSNTGPVEFDDVIVSSRKAVAELEREGINKIIALGHAGILIDKHLAASVPGIDVVIGGHTNTFLYSGDPPANAKQVAEGPYPWIVRTGDEPQNVTLVVQDYAYGKYLGFLRVEFSEDGRVLNWTGNPILMDYHVQEDNATLVELVDWRALIQAQYSVVIGHSTEFLDGATTSCRLRECNLGNVITDSMVDYFSYDPAAPAGLGGVTAAIVNGGSVRGSIEPGDIQYEDALNVMPFGNTIDVIDISGKDLIQVLEYSVAGYDVNVRDGKFLQISGIKVVYDLSKPNGYRVVSALIRSCPASTEAADSKTLCAADAPYEPIQSERTYRIATSSFIVRGGDGYTMILTTLKKHFNLGLIDIDLFVSYLKRRSPVSHVIEGRITFSEIIGCDTRSQISCRASSVTTGWSLTSLTAYSLLCLAYIYIILV